MTGAQNPWGKRTAARRIAHGGGIRIHIAGDEIDRCGRVQLVKDVKQFIKGFGIAEVRNHVAGTQHGVKTELFKP